MAIIALNEEERIRPCLESVSWADELVVVDAGSSDKTVQIARDFTDRVMFHPWSGYASQKNFAIDQCHGDWILSLDADERVSGELRQAIVAVLAADSPIAGYFVPRKNHFQGAWIRHGGWYPDHQLRLFRRRHGRFADRRVHESVRVDGTTAVLAAPLIHESYRGVDDFLARAHRYAALAARELAAEGRGGGLVDLLLRPAWRFVVMYLIRLGFLDGWRGLVLAALYAQYVFVRAVRVRELRAGRSQGPR